MKVEGELLAKTGDYMDIIKWRNSYETGIAEMDNEHRQLIQLINQLLINFDFARTQKHKV